MKDGELVYGVGSKALTFSNSTPFVSRICRQTNGMDSAAMMVKIE
jgi:hypothetical protein